VTNAYDVAHFLAGMMLVCSFTLLYQDRIFAVLNTFAAQAMMLSLAVAWQGYVQSSPDLFITAAMAFGLKGIVIPVALNRMIIRLGIQRDVDQVVNAGVAMFLGLGLTSLALLLVQAVLRAIGFFVGEEGLAVACTIERVAHLVEGIAFHGLHAVEDHCARDLRVGADHECLPGSCGVGSDTDLAYPGRFAIGQCRSQSAGALRA